MTLKKYGMLKGKLKFGIPYYLTYRGNPHYYLILDVNGKEEKVAVNTRSQDKSEVLFYGDRFFKHPVLDRLKSMEFGFTQNMEGLDYWRDRRLLAVARMTFLPVDLAGEDNDLNDLISNAIDVEISDRNSMEYLLKTSRYQEQRRAFKAIDSNINIYVFGDRFDSNDGIHEVHMNQGNTRNGGYSQDNGICQDGGLLIEKNNSFRGLFFAFQAQKLPTDNRGFPISTAKSILELN
jgi:uncharacterized protein YukJ